MQKSEMQSLVNPVNRSFGNKDFVANFASGAKAMSEAPVEAGFEENIAKPPWRPQRCGMATDGTILRLQAYLDAERKRLGIVLN